MAKGPNPILLAQMAVSRKSGRRARLRLSAAQQRKELAQVVAPRTPKQDVMERAAREMRRLGIKVEGMSVPQAKKLARRNRQRKGKGK
jgi:hypothetical protein